MQYQEILKELQNKIYRPIYFLEGDEPYYIDKISDYIEKNVLSEDLKGFNQTTIYGENTTIEEIISLARKYPMFSDYQVIIVKEAQNLRIIKNGSNDDDTNENEDTATESIADGKKETGTPLELYALNPQKTSILVFCYKGKTIDGRSKLAKILDKNACLFKSDAIRDYKLPEWIGNYLREINISYDYKIPELLAEHLGNDLHKIVNEIEKLKNADPKLTRITSEIIEKNIGISKNYNVFELSDAFAKRDIERIFTIFQYLSDNTGGKDPRTLSFLFSFFQRVFIMYYLPGKTDDDMAKVFNINAYIVKICYRVAQKNYSATQLLRILALIREYDMKSKGVNRGSMSDFELYRELALKILVA